MNTDNKKRRSFVAPLIVAGYGERWAMSLLILAMAFCPYN